MEVLIESISPKQNPKTFNLNTKNKKTSSLSKPELSYENLESEHCMYGDSF